MRIHGANIMFQTPVRMRKTCQIHTHAHTYTRICLVYMLTFASLHFTTNTHHPEQEKAAAYDMYTLSGINSISKSAYRTTDISKKYHFCKYISGLALIHSFTIPSHKYTQAHNGRTYSFSQQYSTHIYIHTKHTTQYLLLLACLPDTFSYSYTYTLYTQMHTIHNTYIKKMSRMAVKMKIIQLLRLSLCHYSISFIILFCVPSIKKRFPSNGNK